MTDLHTTLAEIIEDAIDSVHDLDVAHTDYANAAAKAVIEAITHSRAQFAALLGIGGDV